MASGYCIGQQVSEANTLKLDIPTFNKQTINSLENAESDHLINKSDQHIQ